jgi:hypothetical protein
MIPSRVPAETPLPNYLQEEHTEREYVCQEVLLFEKRCKIKMIILKKIQLFFTAPLPANRKRSEAESKMKNSSNNNVFPAKLGCLYS